MPKPDHAGYFFVSNPSTRVYVGDCRKVMTQQSHQQYDLVFGDPPFNIGQDYAEFDDNMTVEQYLDFTIEWLNAAMTLLRPGGTLCVHAPDAVAPLVLLTGMLWGKEQIAYPADWIIWHYRFGQSGTAAKSTKCINSKCHLLVYRRAGGERTWNPPMVPSDRATKYKDSRTADSETPGERVALDVWGVPSDGQFWGRVQGNNEERWDVKHGALVDHPNQLPEVYVARAISAFSNEGDRLLCPFGGSGTETVVARALNRQIDTIEISEVSAKSIVKRIQRGAVRIRPIHS